MGWSISRWRRDPRSPAEFLAELNRAGAVLTSGAIALSILAFTAAQLAPRPGDHGGLYGVMVSVYLLPFVPAFWLASRAWARGWRTRFLLQLLPLAVAWAWGLAV